MELKDPLNNRRINIKKPNHSKLKHDEVFDSNGNIVMDWKKINNHFLSEGRLENKTIDWIIRKSSKLLQAEPNLLYLQDPLYIIGDIHGQYFDLNTIFNLVGDPLNMKYLFLGDYVDRGNFGVECILMLLILKIKYPNNIFMLRGNHESRELTNFFNFKSECLYKYNENIYYFFTEVFDKLPFSCIINGRFLALHGGISPNMIFLTDFNKINRFQEPPKKGILCDVLWADPIDNINGQIPNNKYKFNESRGCSYFFGHEASKELFKNNELLMIIRAHEAQIDGFKAHLWGDIKNKYPQVLTIFSAPNYCGCYGNQGAVIEIKNNNLNIKQFSNVNHPYFLPNYLNIFNWSLPFVSEKLYEMGYSILKEKFKDMDDDDSFEGEIPEEVYKVFNIQKPLKKIKEKNTGSIFDSNMVWSNMNNINNKMKKLKKKRRKSELVLEKIDINGKKVSKKELEDNDFNGIKSIDSVNEVRPSNPSIKQTFSFVDEGYND